MALLAAGGTHGEARHAAETAVMLDDDLAEAHAAMADVSFDAWDWEGTQREFERALQLSDVVHHPKPALCIRVSEGIGCARRSHLAYFPLHLPTRRFGLRR